MRVGNNFPSSALKTMKTWETTLQRLEEPNHGLTNPVFEYGDTHFRSRFSKCLTRTLEVLPDHLVDTPHLLSSKVFHVVAGPVALKQQIARLLHLRKQAGLKGRPFILWEPANESCTQDNKQAFLEVMPQVDVISPTHFQLAIILGRKAPVFYDQVGIKGLSSEFIHLAVGKSCKGAIVLRAGRGGFFIKSGWIPTQHLPAFYQATQHHRSVDVTGEGSAFLGALAIGLLETGNLVEAAMYGVVATSFAGEQVGVPALSHAEDGRELWNNQSVRSRLAEYRAHVSLDD
ncbi:hypothetical protein MMC24_001213 [Lignoscripta atroalba]|nr:hypothetical protein [Lignoscripta atroalba]